MTNAQLKELSKKQLKGNIGTLIISLAIIWVVNWIFGRINLYSYQLNDLANTGINYSFNVTSVFSTIITAPLQVGLCGLLLRLTNGEKTTPTEIFSGFESWLQSFIAAFLTSVIVGLGFVLLIIPGVIWSLSYSMTYYVLAENPGMSGWDAMQKSKELMKGHKADLFILNLSFIGWFLLVAVTLGLAAFYVSPYFEVTQANFYNDIKRQNLEKTFMPEM